MNKTVTANIGGFVFNIDEQAYETLQHYFAAIRKQMQAEDADEVMHDIEMRVAEIFREKLEEFKREVINANDVNEVISIMGAPEDYGTGEQKHSENIEQENYYESNRQIFRDPDDYILGGVCSGLAAYMKWDPLIVRLIFVLLFFGFGTGFFLYILLWMIVPEAKTTADRLRMRGEKINVENIKQKFQNIKTEFQEKETGKKIKKGVHQLVDNFGETFGGLAKIFAAIIGAMFIIAAIGVIALLIKMMLQSEIVYLYTFDETYSISYNDLERLFFNSSAQANLGYLGFVLLLTSIATSFILSAIRLLFKVKTPTIFKFILGGAFSLSVIFIIICSARVGYDFSHDDGYSEQIKLHSTSDTLYIETMEDPYFSENLKYDNDILFETVKIKNDHIVFGYPELKIKQGNSEKFELIIEKSAHGSNKREALSRAESIHYKFSQKDSLLKLAPYFTTHIDNKLRLQRVTITLYVPNGKNVYLGKKITRILNDNNDVEEDEADHALPINTILEMSPEGLKRK